MHQVTSLLLSFFFLLTSFCNSHNIHTIQNKPSKRALLIGINKYPYVRPKLNGCINDVMIMQSMLINKYNFPATQIVTITDEKATRKGILDAFRQLITATNSNDTVVIHYSGHGSQIADKNEVDGQDETIIPYDYRDSPYGAYPITDKQISGILDELSKKTNNITIILDCCHSGGGTKGLFTGIAREIPSDSREAPKADEFLPREKAMLLKKTDAQYVLLAGCRSDQKSYETKASNGIYNGILTLSFVNCLLHANEPKTWPAVVEDIKTQITKNYDSQTPELAGLNRNSYVFGDPYVSKESYLTVQPGKNIIKVNGGAVLGVTKGSVYHVYPPGTIDFNNGSIAQIKISKVDVFTSEATIEKGKVPAANCRAIEFTHSSDREQKLFVSFKGPWNGAALLIKKNILSLSNIIEDNTYQNITYFQQGDMVNIYSGQDTTNILASYPLRDVNTAETLKSSAIRWNKWFRVANISNINSKLSVDVHFDTGKDINLNKEDFIYADNTTVNFSIQNKSAVRVFVSIIDLNDNGDIDVYTLNQFRDRSQSINEYLESGAVASCSFKAHVNLGQSVTRDVMKIFVTTTPVKFDYYQQNSSKLIEDEDKEKSIEPGNGSLTLTNDWNTIQKVIFVKKQ